MKIENLKNKKTQTLQEVAYDWGIDYQAFLVKMDMVNTIQEYYIQKKQSEKIGFHGARVDTRQSFKNFFGAGRVYDN